MLQTRAVSQPARSGLVTVKSQNWAKNMHGRSKGRGSHMSKEVILLKEGKWGNETPGLTPAGREQKL